MIIGEVKPTAIINLAGLASIKATRGHVTSAVIINPNNSLAYLQLFDVSSLSAITLGTTIPNAVIPLTASGAGNATGLTVAQIDSGWFFANGIMAACTTTSNGSTTVAIPVNGTLGIE